VRQELLAALGAPADGGAGRHASLSMGRIVTP
jgi:hypothetical protein